MSTHVIGTAGHIDHGKTALIRALTGIDTDRLKEEKERNMTIDLGFAHLELPSGREISIVDVPGHEKFVKNMLAGATGIDLVLFVVAADEGMMPQSKEHLDILNLLGLKNGIIVITKKDLAGKEWLELIKEDVREAVKGTFLENAPLLEVSSINGEGLDKLVALIEEHFELLEDRPFDAPVRYPIDRVFSISGFGTVVTGTLWEGEIKVGDELVLLPQNETVRVRNLQSHNRDVESASAAVRLAINLAAADKEEINRGNVICSPGYFKPTRIIDVELKLLDSAPIIKHAEKVHFYLGTKETMGKVRLLYKKKQNPGEVAYAQILLEEPIVAKRRDRFVIRRFSPLVTIGGGIVLSPYPKRKRLNEEKYLKEFDVYKNAENEGFARYVISASGYRGVTLDRFKLLTSIKEEEAKQFFKDFINRGQVFKVGKTYFDSEVEKKGKELVLTIIKDYFSKNSWAPGMDREELKSKTGIRNRKLYTRILDKLTKEGKIDVERDSVNIKGREASLSSVEKEIKSKLEQKFLSNMFQPPSPADAIESFNRNSKAAKKLFNVLVEDEILLKASAEVYFHRKAVEEAKKKIKDLIETGGPAKISEIRDELNTSRKYVVPLMEYLDKLKFTKRIGDERILGNGP